MAAHLGRRRSARACLPWPLTTTRGVPSSAFGSDLLKRLQVPCPSVRSIAVQVSPGQGSTGRMVILAVGSVKRAYNPSQTRKRPR